MSKPEKEIEKKYSHNRQQLAEFLKNLVIQIEAGEVIIGEERIQLPEDVMDVEYGFKIEKGKNEIEIEVKWKSK